MNSEKQQAIILFDGVCLLCQSSVRIILKHDTGKKFLFAPMQGSTAKRFLTDSLSEKGFDTLLLIDNEKVFTRSTAALRIARHLRFPINLCYVFILVPRIIRDRIYDYISNNRYRWFGKSASCMLPTTENKARFLD